MTRAAQSQDSSSGALYFGFNEEKEFAIVSKGFDPLGEIEKELGKVLTSCDEEQGAEVKDLKTDEEHLIIEDKLEKEKKEKDKGDETEESKSENYRNLEEKFNRMYSTVTELVNKVKSLQGKPSIQFSSSRSSLPTASPPQSPV